MMTDYEQALTVAIKALSELIEDNRKLVAEIETLRESKSSTSSNQSGGPTLHAGLTEIKPLYGIRLDVLTGEIKSAYHEYVGAVISTSNAIKIAQHLSDCANSFIIL